MAWSEKYVSVAGAGAHDGTTEANAWTFAEAIAAYAAGDRVNVKAGTYALGAGDAAFATAGTTTAPVWFRGYNTAIGDIDANNALTKPLFTFTGGGRWKGDQPFHTFQNFDMTGDQAIFALARVSDQNCRFIRCRINCTAASSDGRALLINGTNTVCEACEFVATSSAHIASVQAATTFIGCVFKGGSRAIDVQATTLVCWACVFRDTGGDCINSANGSSDRVWFLGNTVYSPGSDGVEFAAIPGNGIVVGNIFDSAAAYGVNNSSGANTATIFRSHNLFHASGTANENGMGDSPSHFEQTDSGTPFTNAAGGDLSVLSTSNAKANGPPKGFENESYTSYLDIGAVQREEPAAAGGGLLRPVGQSGGLV